MRNEQTWGYLDSEKMLVSTDRLNAPTTIAGASKKEKRRLAALEARRNYLEVKLQDIPIDDRGYDRAELAALDWALEVIQEYFDLVNATEEI